MSTDRLIKVTVNFPEPAARHMPFSLNDWWFNIFGTDDADASANEVQVLGHLVDYYTLNNAAVTLGPTGFKHPSAYLANNLTGPTFRVVDIDRTTGHEEPLTATEGPIAGWVYHRITAAQDLPYEVALCQSYRGSFSGLAGRHKARARGRVYLGPFSTAALITTAANSANPALIECMNANHARMVAAIEAIGSAPLCRQVVYSRVDHLIRPVESGWVDGEYDTQRRRGGLLTPLGVRVTWP